MKKLTFNPEKEILSAKQVMELLSISRNTFDRMRKSGKLKVYKINRKLYCKYSEILATLEANQV